MKTDFCYYFFFFLLNFINIMFTNNLRLCLNVKYPVKIYNFFVDNFLLQVWQIIKIHFLILKIPSKSMVFDIILNEYRILLGLLESILVIAIFKYDICVSDSLDIYIYIRALIHSIL